MKYSIIIPCYKAENKIDELFTMMHFDYSDYEIIFVDDCSTDDTYNELIKKSAAYSNYVVSRTDYNGGPGVARNKGLDKAKGEYIIFVDADDKFDYTVLNKADKILEEDTDLIVYPYKIVSKDKVTIMDAYKNMSVDGLVKLTDIAMDSGSVCNKIFKKEIIEEYNIRFPQRLFGEDKCFVINYLVHVKNAKKIIDPSYEYIMNSSSITHEVHDDDENTTFEELRPLYHKYFPEIEEIMYVDYYLLSTAKKMYQNKKSFKEIKEWFTIANKEYPNWIKEVDFESQSIYRKLIYKAMYNANPYMIKLIMWIREVMY